MAEEKEKQDSYTRLFNPILEALYKKNDLFTKNEYAIILFVIRSTYGWQKKKHPMSVSFIAKGTGIPERSVKRSIKNLINKRVLLDYGTDGDTRKKQIGLNKSYSQWGTDSDTRVSDSGDTLLVPNVVNKGDSGDILGGDTGDTQKINSYLKKKDKKEKEKKCSSNSLFFNSETETWEIQKGKEQET